MDDRMLEPLSRCLEELQGFTTAPEALIDPSRVVAGLGQTLRRAAITLPFDADPTGFAQRLEDAAGRKDQDV